MKECRKHCADLHAIVQTFKVNRDLIERNCRRIATTLLINIEKNYVYEEGVFEQRQSEHRGAVRQTMEDSHAMIKDTMLHMYDHFKDDPPSIQRHWNHFIAGVDKNVSDALHMTVKKSLQEVSRSINGDARTDPQPLFKVSVVLDHNRVEFRPTMIKLTQTVNLVSKDLITTIACIPCLADVLVKAQKARAAAAALASEEEGANGRRTVAKGAVAAAPAADEDGKAATEEGGEGEGGDGGKVAAEEGALVADAGPAEPEKETFYDRISNDEDILKILVQIMNGMSASATELQKYLSQWDKYKPLWEMDKDAFIRRYAKASRPLSQYDIDITRYKDQQNDIVEEDLNMTINFIKIESSLLKATLTDHCVQWQNKLLKLLNDNALQELKSIQSMFKENTETLESHSQTLEELGNKINLHKGCNAAQGETEARFEPVEEMYDKDSFTYNIQCGEICTLTNEHFHTEI